MNFAWKNRARSVSFSMNLINLDIRMLRSLMSVVETGSITETARRLGRTQPAITLQLQRLEELTGKAIFIHEGRRLFLTAEGETVLSYARSILGFHDELLSQLASPDIEGHVVLGTPDLYAAFMLPSILKIFRKAFPRVQLELNCSLSTPLVGCVKRGDVDIALVTRMNDFTGGQVVRQEQLIWMTGEQSTAHNETPMPLALLPPGNIFRDHAIEALEAARLRWRIACVSHSVSGLQAAAFAGMAVTVLGRSALVRNMREIGEKEGLPPLPKVDLLLYKSPTATSKAASALHDYLAHYLNLDDELLLGKELPLSAEDAAVSRSAHPGPKLGPGLRPLERGGDAHNQPLVEPGRDNLKPDRKPIRIEAAGDRRGRQPGQVYRPRERRPS
jgi:DNA-binding transcriptional LysR family regulator